MKLFLVLLFVACATVAFAQSNYHQGYVIKPNGDTLKGYINYREWSQSPTEIDFKVNKEDKQSQHFTPQTIKKFKINGFESYKSYMGLISNDRNRFPDLPDNLDTSKIQSAIFMKELLRGRNLSFYSAVDNRKIRYFVVETDGKTEELKYYQYYNDQHETVERPFFRGQLIFYINKYLPGNTTLSDMAGTTLFQEGPLVEIISKINGNQDYIASEHTKSNARFFLGGSISFNQTSYTNNNFQQLGDYGSHYYAVSNSSPSVSPQLDLGVDLFINPNVQQFIFRTEVSITELSPRITYPIPGVLDSQPVDILTFNQYTASIHPQLIFNFYNKDNVKLYIDGGASLNFSSYANKKFTSTSTGQIDESQQGNDFNSFWVSIPVGLGVVLNRKIDISISYLPKSNFTPQNTPIISNQAINAGIKYLFGGR
jgi:hypothetical protein